MSVLGYYSDRAEAVPFAAGDADILEDIDFTQYASSAEFTAANTNWTAAGSGHVFDGNGFNGKGTGHIYTSALTGNADLAAANEGTLLIQVEREAIAMDEGASKFSADFVQSSGTTGSTRYLFELKPSAGTNYFNAFYQSNDVFRQRSICNGSEVSANSINFNSQIPGGLDSYLDYVLTWKGYEWWLLIDGVPVGHGIHADKFDVAGRFAQLILGGQGTGGSNKLGDYYIRRMQISKRAAIPVFMPIRMAVFGDSFFRASVDSEDHLTADSLTQYSEGSGRAGRYSAMHEFSRQCVASGLGLPRLIYGAGTTENGHGWASDFSQFSQATIDAVIAANPEIIICGGSVNDVTGVAPADIFSDTTAILDQFIDGIPSLREIHFFEQFPGLGGSTASDTAAQHTNSQANRTAQAAVSGYRSKVIYHATRGSWDESFGSYTNPEYTIGSAPTNAKTANSDIHPSTLGHLEMGRIFYSGLSGSIGSKPVRFV